MRLAYIVTYFPTLTETFILRELLEFKAAGADIRIYHLTPYQTGVVMHEFAQPALSWARSSNYLFDTKIISATIRAFFKRPKPFFEIIAQLFRSYWKEPKLLIKSLAIIPKSLWIAEDLSNWKADHLHAGFAGHPATAAWIINKISGIPYSSSCHGHDIFRTQSMLSEKLTRAAFVRVISKYNKQFILDRVERAEEADLKVIHCGVDTDISFIAPPVNPAPFNILYVGSLQPRKGVEYLLHAVAKQSNIDNWTLTIIGDGPDRQKLEALANSLPVAAQITFLGGQPSETVASELGRSNVLVVPSVPGPGGRAEGIPTVLMEALAQGRPVIASKLTGIPELVKDGETGLLVPPGDSASLASALDKVRSDPEAALGFAENGRQLVIDEFDIKKNSAEQFVLFQQHSAKLTGHTQ